MVRPPTSQSDTSPTLADALRRPELELVTDDARERRLLRALDLNATGRVLKAALPAALSAVGLRTTDVRLAESMTQLDAYRDGEALTHEQILTVMRPNLSLIERALRGELVVPDFKSFSADIIELRDRSVKATGGAVASYIPQLARVNPELFGVSVCTVDGQRFGVGDVHEGFSVQSCSKPISYCAALEEHGEEVVHRTVGREPSGRGFNELTLNKDQKPHNPMINSGAIATLSLLQPRALVADRFDAIMDFWTRLAGGERPGFLNAVYLSERQTADRNFALGYFMRENKVFREDTDLVQTLEFYFQCCSIESNTEKMSVIAATLANGGVCPTTGERVLKPSTVRACLSLMSSCGMYDFSGEFAFTIGLPAKSGVSGALMIVVPNVMGICTWAPRLDAVGNSVRGIEFSKGLVERFNFHNYDNLVSGVEAKRDPRRRTDDRHVETVTALCWAASQGDLRGVERLVAQGARLDVHDYDGRTPLHLAASEGQTAVVQAFIARGVNLSHKDRWGNAPVDDAKRGGHKAIVELLEQASASRVAAG
jgi:glutaminase